MVKYELEDHPFQGILFNQKENYEINISKENYDAKRPPNLVDNNPRTYSCTSDAPYPYYIFTFKNNLKVKVNKYAVRSHNVDGNNPKQWVLSGYKGNKWINLSTVVESNLKENNASRTFEVDNIEPVSKIKITGIGFSYYPSGQRYNLCMADFELFGLISHFRRIDTCKRTSNSMTNHIFYIVLLVCL